MTHPKDIVYAATAADSAMVVPVMALIQSLAVHSSDTVLGVISVGLTAAEESFLCQCAAGVGLPMHLIPFDPDFVKHTVLRAPHLSRAAYARLFLSELLPAQDRVIYLDTDTLVLENLSALWKMDLNGFLVAAVPDDFIDPSEIAATKSRLGEYFNSGVMVINLAQWRADNLMPRIIAVMASPDLICEDQSVLNMICANRVQLLDRKWNFFTRRFSEYPSAHRYVPPLILHYGGTPKPWVGKTAFGLVFLNYLPADIRQKVRAGFTKTSMMRRLDLAQRRIFGLLLGRQKHWIAVVRAVDLAMAQGRLAWRLVWKRRRIRKDTP
jgi:lipopolysaccharide biosynthesis glycosyltransferase